MSLVRLFTRNALNVNKQTRSLTASAYYSPLIPEVHPPLNDAQGVEIAASSDCWVGYKQNCLRNESYYYENRGYLLSKYKGKWLGFCGENLIAVDDHPIYVRKKLFDYHEETGTTDEFVVLCGYELVNTYPNNVFVLDHPSATKHHDSAVLQMGNICEPHPSEWKPLKPGEMKPEWVLFRGTHGLRSFVRLPVTFKQLPNIEFPVTFYADTGSPFMGFSNVIFDRYRSVVDNRKVDPYSIAGSILGAGHAFLPTCSISAASNISVVSLEFLLYHKMLAQYQTLRDEQNIEIGDAHIIQEMWNNVEEVNKAAFTMIFDGKLK